MMISMRRGWKGKVKKPSLGQSHSDRLEFLDGLRALAALYVVIGHLISIVDPVNLVGGISALPSTIRLLTEPFRQGHLAVVTFIVISGFSLSVSEFRQGRREGKLRRSIGDFFKRRARRILPPYYACLLLSCAVAIYVSAKQNVMPFLLYVPVTPQNFLAHVFLIQNWNLGWMYKINGVLWSIAVEAQLYLFFPALLWCTRNLGKFLTIGLSLAVTYVVMTRVPEPEKLYPWFLPLFAAGMAAAQAAYRPSQRVGPRPGIGIGLAVVGICLGVFAIGQSEFQPTRDLPFGLGVAALLYVLTVDGLPELRQLLSQRALVFTGGFSYSLYLMHHPIEQILYVYRPAGLTDSVATLGYMLGAALPVILFTTWLFSLAFERPFMRKESASRGRKFRLVTSLPLKAAGKSSEVRGRAVVDNVARLRSARMQRPGVKTTEESAGPTLLN